MSDKKIQDYLHYYLGCEVQIESELFMTEGKKDVIRDTLWSIDADGYVECKKHVANTEDIKPILSKLEDMSEEDWIKCFELSRGVVDQSYDIKNIQRLSTTERMIVLGKGQYVFGFNICSDNDVRIGDGICFYLKSYLIKDDMSVSEIGIQLSESWYNDMKIEPVLNITHIIHYLLFKKYWLFGNDWFDEGLTIDRKTLQS